MQTRGRRSIWVLGGCGGFRWEGQRAGPAARRVCHGLGAVGGLDWRRGLQGRSRGTCSRGQLKFLKDDLVLENSARSCRRVADPGALAVWGGEWVPPNRVVATAAQTQDSVPLTLSWHIPSDLSQTMIRTNMTVSTKLL